MTFDLRTENGKEWLNSLTSHCSVDFVAMQTLTTKHQRLVALRPLSPESVARRAAACDVRMVTGSDHFTEVSKMIPDPQP